MSDALAGISTRRTPQSQPARSDQVVNRAGGYVFEVDDLTRLRRFLTLGVDGGTYYANAGELARENAEIVMRMAQNNPAALLLEIVDVSQKGRAPRQQPCIFALAVAASVGDADERANALAFLPSVCRTGTHLFQFATYVEQFRGWGRQLRRGVAAWYTSPDVDDVAFQTVKYRSREGWTHRDLLRLCHAELDKGLLEDADPETWTRKALFNWITHGVAGDRTPMIVQGFELANEPGRTPAQIADLVGSWNLSWEMLPDHALGERVVWEALLANRVPAIALMRQLPRLTNLGLLDGKGPWRAGVVAALTNPERLKRARVHPINVLVAQRTYASGRSARGSGTWTPVRQIIDALDESFYAAFGAVEPAGKRTMLALDVSGSMAMTPIANMPLTPREASAALALVQMATEPDTEVVGFTSGRPNAGYYMMRDRMDQVNGLTALSLSPRQRLDDAIRSISDLEFGRTDCSLPMRHATKHGLEVETFVIYTDNETWAGNVMHPHQALEEYRQKTGIPAKLIVVAMTGTGHSIADPTDSGMLDVSGFDSTVPSLISDFSRGL